MMPVGADEPDAQGSSGKQQGVPCTAAVPPRWVNMHVSTLLLHVPCLLFEDQSFICTSGIVI